MAKHVEIKYGSNVFVSFLLFSLHHFCSDYDAACIGRILHIRLRRARSVSFSERCTAHCCPLHTNFRYYLFSHFAFLFSISEKLVSERFQVKFITGALKRIRGNRPGLIQKFNLFSIDLWRRLNLRFFFFLISFLRCSSNWLSFWHSVAAFCTRIENYICAGSVVGQCTPFYISFFAMFFA